MIPHYSRGCRVDIRWNRIVSELQSGPTKCYQRFNSEQGGQDKACVAEIQKMDDFNGENNSEKAQIKIEETSGSESESLSDSDTQSDSDADIEDSVTQFALMVNSFAIPNASSQSDQVSQECSSSSSRCFNCVDLDSKVLAYQNHNSALISDLNQCIEANKVLKSNEKDFQSKIELLNRQLHEAEIAVLNKQDAITSYLNTINEIKKKLAIVECDYETLGQKLKSYESSSYIIEHMISKGTDQKGKGKMSYQHCPPPILNSFVNSPDDKDVKDFQVKTPLVIDPIGMITDEGFSLSEESFVEGIVEDWVSDSEDESDYSSNCDKMFGDGDGNRTHIPENPEYAMKRKNQEERNCLFVVAMIIAINLNIKKTVKTVVKKTKEAVLLRLRNNGRNHTAFDGNKSGRKNHSK
ncbi:hypothetical protein R6Q59_029523 [Mikania micrantha]